MTALTQGIVPPLLCLYQCELGYLSLGFHKGSPVIQLPVRLAFHSWTTYVRPWINQKDDTRSMVDAGNWRKKKKWWRISVGQAAFEEEKGWSTGDNSGQGP